MKKKNRLISHLFNLLLVLIMVLSIWGMIRNR